MLKAVTFKAAQNFKANLYALEVRSRFKDQSKANGYYSGYGNSLSATVVGTSGITIGSGAFVVQGRMVEVVSSETVSIAYQEGKVGYIICRIETSPSSNTENCSLVARTASSLSEISLTQENTYEYASESTNKVYELPIYSFVMQNTAITSVTRLIKPIVEITEIALKADQAITAINRFYPVGSIYMSVKNTSPASFFGGTWTAWGTGRVPIGVNTSDSDFSTVEKTGGEKTVTLTTSQIPSHTHSGASENTEGNQGFYNVLNARVGYSVELTYKLNGGANIGTSTETYATGGGGAHSNVQPYITCYMWKRIA